MMGRRMEPQEVRLAMLRDLYTKGYTIAEICKEMGYKTPETPINYLRNMGIYEDYGGIDVRRCWHSGEPAGTWQISGTNSATSSQRSR